MLLAVGAPGYAFVLILLEVLASFLTFWTTVKILWPNTRFKNQDMKLRTFLLVLFLFGLSGFTALVYEAVWTRYLKLVFGHAAYGQMLTLLIFLGGMGVGAIYAGKLLSKIKSPLKAYIITELIIAVGAFLYHALYGAITGLIFSSAFVGVPALLIGIIKLILCLLITLPWAFAIGATFPFMASVVLRQRGDQDGWVIPLLYTVNALGGAMGIITASFWMLSEFGTIFTLVISGLMNFAIASACWLLIPETGLLKSANNKSEKKSKSAEGPESYPEAGRQFVCVFLIATFLSSAASFIYEIAWIRLLSLVLGSATHTFDLVVAVFIIGLALGSVFSRYLIRFCSNSGYVLGLVQVLMGIAAATSIFTCDTLFEMANAHHAIFAKTNLGYVFYNLYKIPIAVFLMFPACFFAGMTLPLIITSLVRITHSENYTGYAYGLNTLGSIVGVVVGAMLLLPLLQLKNTILAGAAMDMAIGVFLLFRYANKSSWVPWIAVPVSLTLLITGFVFDFNPGVVSSGAFRHKVNLENEKTNDVTIRDGKTATISLIKTERSIKIATNGKVDASVSIIREDGKRTLTTDDETMAMLAYIPMQTRKGPYDVAVVGMGSGMTVHHLLSDPLVKSVDIIEIEEAVIDLAQGFAPHNSRTYSDKRVNFIVEDARTYFSRIDKKYDLIISEPSNLWVSGVADLFTKEFYVHIKNRLKTDGILAQWLHIYDFDDQLFLSILHALYLNFKYADLYELLSKGDIVILSSDSDPILEASERVKQLTDVQNEWVRYNWNYNRFSGNLYHSGIDLFIPLFSKIEPNSDFKPTVDLNGERAFFTKTRVNLLQMISIGPPFYHEIFDLRSYDNIEEQVNLIRKDYAESETRQRSAMNLVESTADGLSWAQRKKRVTPILLQFMEPDLWANLELVEKYRQLLEHPSAAEINKVNFEFIEAFALKDNNKLNAALERMLTFKPTDFSMRDVRMAAFYLYRTNQPKRFKKLMNVVVAGIGDPYPTSEKMLLNALLEQCEANADKPN